MGEGIIGEDDGPSLIIVIGKNVQCVTHCGPYIENWLLTICIPRTKYVRGILWFSRRSAAASAAAASADTSSFSR